MGLGLLGVEHFRNPPLLWAHRRDTTTTSNYWVYWRQKARHSLQFLSICFIVLFLPSPVRWQRPRVNKNFATLPPSPTRSSPSIEPHASLQTASHISEAHTATHSCLSKQDITLLLYWGMTGAAGWALDCPGGREVWVHRTLTPLKLLHRQETGITRVNHWSLFLVFWGGGGKKKKKKLLFSWF